MDDLFRVWGGGDVDRAKRLIQCTDAAGKALAFGCAVALMRTQEFAQAVARYRQKASTTPRCAELAMMDATLNALLLGPLAVPTLAAHLTNTPLAAALRTAVQHDNPGLFAPLVEAEVLQQMNTILLDVLGQLGQYPRRQDE